MILWTAGRPLFAQSLFCLSIQSSVVNNHFQFFAIEQTFYANYRSQLSKHTGNKDKCLGKTQAKIKHNRITLQQFLLKYM